MSSGLHDGRVALVTGAGSGIGRSTTERFVYEGGSVIAIDKDDESLEWVKQKEQLGTCLLYTSPSPRDS